MWIGIIIIVTTPTLSPHVTADRKSYKNISNVLPGTAVIIILILLFSENSVMRTYFELNVRVL